MRLALVLLALAVAACGPTDAPSAEAPGVAVDTTVVAEATSTVTVAYKGRLDDGSVFDQSDNATFSLLRVVPGFRAGITGMHVGETKTFGVAPDAGYGDNPPPGIPPNATLNFEVTLLGVR